MLVMHVFGVVVNHVRAVVHGARVVEGLGSLARVYRSYAFGCMCRYTMVRKCSLPEENGPGWGERLGKGAREHI